MSLWKRVFIAILIAGMTVLPLSACGQNNPETYDYAKKLFDAHRAQFEQLVKLIGDCKGAFQVQIDRNPELSTGINGNGPICSNHSTAYSNRISRRLAKLNILWAVPGWKVSSDSSKFRFSSVSFVLSSHGLMVGPSHGSAIWYFVKPQVNIEGSKPLTSIPSRWWFNFSVSKS